MAGTPEGGIKAREANLAKDPNFYQKIGAIGGSVKNPNKGFAQWDKQKLKEMASKNGRSNKGRTRVVH